MGLSDIPKAPVSHGVEPHDFVTGPGLRVPLSAHRPPAVHRRGYRASGLVLTSTPDGYGRRVCANTGHSTAIRRTVRSDGKRWVVASPRRMRRQRQCLERWRGGHRGKETAGHQSRGIIYSRELTCRNHNGFRFLVLPPVSTPVLPLLYSPSTRRLQKGRRPPFAPRASLRTCLRPRECLRRRP